MLEEVEFALVDSSHLPFTHTLSSIHIHTHTLTTTHTRTHTHTHHTHHHTHTLTLSPPQIPPEVPSSSAERHPQGPQPDWRGARHISHSCSSQWLLWWLWLRTRAWEGATIIQPPSTHPGPCQENDCTWKLALTEKLLPKRAVNPWPHFPRLLKTGNFY